jgi:ElaB/YqjD/DUF883 family membrane-anchored ribosome-binding protein
MDEFEVIKQQMEARRSSLAEKLEALENQVAESVQEVTSAVSTVTEVVQDTVETVKGSVQETVQTVKGSVQDTVGAVKETFDLSRQMEAHPWVCMAGAFGFGFVAGHMLGGGQEGYASRRSTFWDDPGTVSPSSASQGTYASSSQGNYRSQAATDTNGRHRSSWMAGISSLLGPEVDKLKGVAIGAALGLFRDAISQSAPPDLGRQLCEVIDSITTKLGGQPIRDNLAGGSSNYQFSQSR